MDESCIKLFLSVDIAGSTKLKNTNNYFQIQKFCEEHLRIEDALREQQKEVGKTQHKKTLKDIYEIISKDESHQDWSQIISKCFEDFNTEFIKNLNKKTIFPWKMAGDELIYCENVDTRDDVHIYLMAFFKTLRFFDKKYLDKGSYIRLKGSAWTAGFPIRNRIMTPITYPNFPKQCIPKTLCSLNTEDYMGPEIDIGFRIGKFTFPGIIVISLELAYILLTSKFSNEQTERLRVIDTGWEVLKGVWEEKKYPILWLDLPEIYDDDSEEKPADAEEITYIPYKKWEVEEDSHVKNYDLKKKSLKIEPANKYETEPNYETKASIKRIFESLPKSFDVEIPYFTKAGEKLPAKHKERAKFIKSIEEVLEKNKVQTTDKNITNKKKLTLDQGKILDLWKSGLDSDC